MKVILILYFLYRIYVTIKMTSTNLNEEKYKQFMQENADNMEVSMSRLPAEYRGSLVNICMTMSAVYILIHTAICIYTGLISHFSLVTVICFLEAIYTIYSFLLHWKEFASIFSGKNNMAYHKYESRLDLVLNYVCYTLVLVSLLAF